MKFTTKMKYAKYTMEELVPVVKTLTEKYTGKESTSVTYETAERLMGAVIFCINEYHQETVAPIPSREVAGNELWYGEKRLPADEAYDKGYQAVINKVFKAKAMYEGLISDFRWYGNQALYDTIITGMPAFFLHYDARFYPQNHILTLDYPVLRQIDRLYGVDVIYEYLQNILLEQRFLSGFSPDKVEEILFQYHADYKELFLNLPEVVMNAVLNNMTDTEDYISGTINDDKEEVKEKRYLALELLIRERYDANQELFEYLKGII